MRHELYRTVIIEYMHTYKHICLLFLTFAYFHISYGIGGIHRATLRIQRVHILLEGPRPQRYAHLCLCLCTRVYFSSKIFTNVHIKNNQLSKLRKG